LRAGPGAGTAAGGIAVWGLGTAAIMRAPPRRPGFCADSSQTY
jgi:hypothetical protein